MVIRWVKKLLGVVKLEAELEATKKELAVKKTSKKKSEKEIATENKEPYVSILSVDVDDEDPSYGSFELDWNEYFILKLRRMGYPGDNDETVVDLWFQQVCRNILLETYEQDAVNNKDNIRYINRKDLGDGKTEVS